MRCPRPKAKDSKARPLLRLSAFQPVERDFAFVRRRERARRSGHAAPPRAPTRRWSRAVSVFDVYEGKGVPDGKKSLAIAVRLQPPRRTLTDAEIESGRPEDRRRRDQGDGREPAELTSALRHSFWRHDPHPPLSRKREGSRKSAGPRPFPRLRERAGDEGGAA